MTTESSSIAWCFRSSSAEDLERLYEVWHASVVATHDFVSQSDLSDICIQVKNDYLPNRPLLVAMDGQNRLVGFMGMNGHEIESLFIDPSSRGRGLGHAFIAQTSAQSRYLEVGVNAQNRQAVLFYEAIGFTVYAAVSVAPSSRRHPRNPAILRSGSTHRIARRYCFTKRLVLLSTPRRPRMTMAALIRSSACEDNQRAQTLVQLFSFVPYLITRSDSHSHR